MTYVTDISPDVLDAGHWVPGRWGVRRWVPAPHVAPEPPEDVACPKCRARASETCRTPSGTHRTPHAARSGDVTCPCGAPKSKLKTYCEPCRVEARRVTWRKQALKKRGQRTTGAAARRLLDAEAAMYGGAA